MLSTLTAPSPRLARLLLSCLTVIAAASLPTGTATGQESIDDLSAGELSRFQAALGSCIEAYNQGRFERAQERCAEASALSPHPAARYVVARMHDRQARCVEAREAYEAARDAQVRADTSESLWKAEYSAALEEHLTRLGDCSPRVVVVCEGPATQEGAVAVVGGEVAARCGQVVAASSGTVTVALSAPGQGVATQEVAVGAQTAPVEVSFSALPAATPVAQGAEVECVDFPDGAALVSEGTLLGGCPRRVPASALATPLVALGPGGLRGSKLAGPDEAREGGWMRIYPDRPVAVRCADPAVTVRVASPAQGREVEATCGALAEAGLALPAGSYEVALTRDYHVSRAVTLEVGGEPATLEVAALDEAPVAFVLGCPADGEAAPTHARIGDVTGPCPLEGALPAGDYGVEVRRDGHEPAHGQVTLAHPGPRQETLPTPEARPFFSPAMITTLAGGAVLVGAIVHDAANLSTLEAYKDAAAQGDEAEYERLQGEVETNITVSRVLYGLGIGVTAAGGAWLIYGWMTQPSSDFTQARREEGTLLVLPTFAPGAGGRVDLGVSARWTF